MHCTHMPARHGIVSYKCRCVLGIENTCGMQPSKTDCTMSCRYRPEIHRIVLPLPQPKRSSDQQSSQDFRVHIHVSLISDVFCTLSLIASEGVCSLVKFYSAQSGTRKQLPGGRSQQGRCWATYRVEVFYAMTKTDRHTVYLDATKASMGPEAANGCAFALKIGMKLCNVYIS